MFLLGLWLPEDESDLVTDEQASPLANLILSVYLDQGLREVVVYAVKMVLVKVWLFESLLKLFDELDVFIFALGDFQIRRVKVRLCGDEK